MERSFLPPPCRDSLGKEGTPLRVLRVNDLVEARPFPSASNWTATLVLEKGLPTTYPVPYLRWSGNRDAPPRSYQAQPVDLQRPSSPWFLWPEGWSGPRETLFGPSDYEAHLGANTGGANGVYWVDLLPAEAAGGSECGPGEVSVRNIVERGKQQVAAVEQAVEADLVFPLLRWRDVARFRAACSQFLLLPQDAEARRGVEEEVLRRRYAKTWAYLDQFRTTLAARKAYCRYQSKGPFYSMYDVGPYTLAANKVVWRRMDRRINAAVVGPWHDPRLGTRPVVPQETCVLIAADSADEAHYLCALLNSSVAGFLVAARSVRGGKGFGSPSLLDSLGLRRFQARKPAHLGLAAASRQAHEIALGGGDIKSIEQEINQRAARLWGLGKRVLRAMERELW